MSSVKRRKHLIEKASGPLPPFIEELRDKIRLNQKTETRRVMKPQPEIEMDMDGNMTANGIIFDQPFFMTLKSSYGERNQIRYLREPLYRGSDLHARYKDDDALVLDENEEPIIWRWKVKTLAQLFMPKVAARTFVHQSSVRFEQVQDITDDSARREGVDFRFKGNHWKKRNPGWTEFDLTDRGSFASLWDSINKKRGFDWASNPWVWVLKFWIIEYEGN